MKTSLFHTSAFYQNVQNKYPFSRIEKKNTILRQLLLLYMFNSHAFSNKNSISWSLKTFLSIHPKKGKNATKTCKGIL